MPIPRPITAFRPPRIPRLSSRALPRPRNQSTKTTTTTKATTTKRTDRILTRASRFLPHRLRTSLQNLRSAPLSHIGAFLILHEITAVLPIFGLTYLFHAMDWVPTSWVLGPWAAWAEDGLKKYVPYFRKKKWFGLDREDGGDDGEDVLETQLRDEVVRENEGRENKKKKMTGWFTRGEKAEKAEERDEDEGSTGEKKITAVWQKVKHAATVDNTEKGYRIGIQIAAAYTITKFLLVPRIALSLWLTPWFARGLVRFRHAVWKKSS
ncbi:hypothetical protein GGS20DRAFT_393900 [Poronia punctata]|nr:hypothetical protein GGS20DRAFT_393900 [Poronia punctata]